MAYYGTGSVDRVIVAGQPVNSRLSEVSWKAMAKIAEVTGLGDDWTERVPIGVRDVEMSHQGWFHTDVRDQILADPASGQQTIAILPEGNDPDRSVDVMTGAGRSEIDVTASRGELVQATITHAITGALMHGRLLRSNSVIAAGAHRVLVGIGIPGYFSGAVVISNGGGTRVGQGVVWQEFDVVLTGANPTYTPGVSASDWVRYGQGFALAGAASSGDDSLTLDGGNAAGFRRGTRFTIAGQSTVYTSRTHASGSSVTIDISPELQAAAPDNAAITPEVPAVPSAADRASGVFVVLVG